jgi:Domain of unknown function (DUF4124)
MRLLRSTTLLIAAVLVCTAALPQSRSSGSKKSGGESVFRCVDANGQSHFGDSQPPQCVGRDTQVLNERGTVLRVIEGEQSRAARLKAEAQEGVARKQREERALRDRMLIETYLSVEDIERLRNQRLELLEAQVNVTRQNMVAMRDRQAKLQDQLARFRPYSDDPDASPLPDHLAEGMVNTVRSLPTYQKSVTSKLAEQEQLKAEFTRDIARFKQLKGLN